MTHPAISLIIPARNAARYLRDAVASAAAQSLPPAQVVIVDDGSTDDTLAVARSLGGPVEVMTQPHAGAAAARNVGLERATGPWVSFLDADDLLHPTKLERQAAALAAGDAAVCLCRVKNFWSPEVPEASRFEADLSPGFRPGQVTTWLAQRAAIDRVGGFDATSTMAGFAEGSDLFLRVQQAGLTVTRIDDVLVDRRLHAHNRAASAGSTDALLRMMKQRLAQRKASA